MIVERERRKRSKKSKIEMNERVDRQTTSRRSCALIGETKYWNSCNRVLVACLSHFPLKTINMKPFKTTMKDNIDHDMKRWRIGTSVSHCYHFTRKKILRCMLWCQQSEQNALQRCMLWMTSTEDERVRMRGFWTYPRLISPWGFRIKPPRNGCLDGSGPNYLGPIINSNRALTLPIS
jgi:hypothetical protein